MINNKMNWNGILVVITLMLLAVGRARAQCQLEQLLGPDTFSGDRFGASLDLDGDRAIVGSFPQNNFGAAYIFERVAIGMWGPPFKLTASDGELFDGFGGHVAIDGDVAIIGAPFDDDAGTNVGSAYVFRRGKGNTWYEEQKLLPSLPNMHDWYGASVAIDLPHIVVAAARTPYYGNTHPGNVYMYIEESPGVWIEEARLQGSDTADLDLFGYDVAIDGDALIVGAPTHDGPQYDEGAAYIFRRNAKGEWLEEAKIVANDQMIQDAFGIGVDIDGDIAVIGAPGADEPVDDEGAVYIFKRQPDATWIQIDKLGASESLEPNTHFGHVVAIENDQILVGHSNWVGPAFLYEHDGSHWELISTLAADDGQDGDHFGNTIALEGDFALIGAWGYTGERGTAYIMGGLLGIDCNESGESDTCEIADGTVMDENANGIPDECECQWDLDGDAVVGVGDLLMLIADFGECEVECPADFDEDGIVGVSDLLILIANFGGCQETGCPWDVNDDGAVNHLDVKAVNDNMGPCKNPDNCPWDVNGDGIVDGADVSEVASHFGQCP